MSAHARPASRPLPPCPVASSRLQTRREGSGVTPRRRGGAPFRWLAASWLALSCAACPTSSEVTPLQVDFIQPEGLDLSSTSAWEALVFYHGGSSEGILVRYELTPGEAEAGLREGLTATKAGETIHLEIAGYGSEDDTLPVARARSGGFAFDGTGPQRLQLFLGQVGHFNRVPTQRLEEPRLGATLTSLSDGSVLLTGGAPVTGAASRQAARLEAGYITQTFASSDISSSLSEPRAHHTASLLGTTADAGQVLLVGGDSGQRLSFAPNGDGLFLPVLDSSPDFGPSASAERFDPISGTLEAVTGMGAERSFHQAVSLLDGGVFLTGGLSLDQSGAVAVTGRCHHYRDGAFLLVAGASADNLLPRVFHQATLLEDGSVLITGGLASLEVNELLVSGREVPQPFLDAEIYRYDRLAFAGVMQQPRVGHSAVRLQDGRVLVSGGLSRVASGTPAAPVLSLAYQQTWETFDPAALDRPGSRTFQVGGKLVYPRAFHQSLLLTDGQVLVVGGIGPDGSSPPPELFDGTDFLALPVETDLAALEGACTTLFNENLLCLGGMTLEGGGGVPVDTLSVYVPALE